MIEYSMEQCSTMLAVFHLGCNGSCLWSFLPLLPINLFLDFVLYYQAIPCGNGQHYLLVARLSHTPQSSSHFCKMKHVCPLKQTMCKSMVTSAFQYTLILGPHVHL